MISGVFVVQMHEEYGGLGLRLKSRPWFEPLGGMAVAHDLMEHFSDDSGNLPGELEALGASIYVRDHGSYNAQRGSFITAPSDHIASDMLQQVSYTMDRDEDELPDPGALSRRPLECEYAEDEIQATCTKAIKLIRDEEVLDGDLPDWLKGAQQRQRFVGWLRRGYRRARRRYRGSHPSGICYAFMQCEDVVERYIKHAYEGCEVRVSIDVRRGRAFITDLTPEYWE